MSIDYNTAKTDSSEINVPFYRFLKRNCRKPIHKHNIISKSILNIFTFLTHFAWINIRASEFKRSDAQVASPHIANYT
jgi:hypothetical protein